MAVNFEQANNSSIEHLATPPAEEIGKTKETPAETEPAAPEQAEQEALKISAAADFEIETFQKDFQTGVDGIMQTGADLGLSPSEITARLESTGTRSALDAIKTKALNLYQGFKKMLTIGIGATILTAAPDALPAGTYEKQISKNETQEQILEENPAPTPREEFKSVKNESKSETEKLNGLSEADIRRAVMETDYEIMYFGVEGKDGFSVLNSGDSGTILPNIHQLRELTRGKNEIVAIHTHPLAAYEHVGYSKQEIEKMRQGTISIPHAPPSMPDFRSAASIDYYLTKQNKQARVEHRVYEPNGVWNFHLDLKHPFIRYMHEGNKAIDRSVRDIFSRLTPEERTKLGLGSKKIKTVADIPGTWSMERMYELDSIAGESKHANKIQSFELGAEGVLMDMETVAAELRAAKQENYPPETINGLMNMYKGLCKRNGIDIKYTPYLTEWKPNGGGSYFDTVPQMPTKQTKSAAPEALPAGTDEKQISQNETQKQIIKKTDKIVNPTAEVFTKPNNVPDADKQNSTATSWHFNESLPTPPQDQTLSPEVTTQQPQTLSNAQETPKRPHPPLETDNPQRQYLSSQESYLEELARKENEKRERLIQSINFQIKNAEENRQLAHNAGARKEELEALRDLIYFQNKLAELQKPLTAKDVEKFNPKIKARTQADLARIPDEASDAFQKYDAQREWLAGVVHSPAYEAKARQNEGLSLAQIKARQQEILRDEIRLDDQFHSLESKNLGVYNPYFRKGNIRLRFGKIPSGTQLDTKYDANAERYQDIPLAVHELQHHITEGNDWLSETAKRLYQEAYIGPSTETEIGKYLSNPTELDARKRVFEYELEKNGIWQYGQPFTKEHLQKALELRKNGKLTDDSQTFLLVIKPEKIIEIMNTIAEYRPPAQDQTTIHG